MKIVKKIILPFLIAAFMGVFSTSVLAEGDSGRIIYTPADAIDLTVGKIKLALNALTSGETGEKVSALTKDALDASKEVNANDKVDIARSKANNKLKAAKNHAKDGALKDAEQELTEALKMFEGLKSLI